jgi:uncharacterized zinc-type alcohol dehydrogenase-like protein
VAWGIENDGTGISPMWVNKPKCGENHVKIEMKFCGVCHTDCHFGLNELGGSIYPMVPGHELVGTVVEVGDKVTKVKLGDNAGVGVIIDSCLTCDSCLGGDEQYCEKGGYTHTYNSKKTYGHIGGNPDTQNFGGYAGSHVCHEKFIIKIPDTIKLETAGPILCAGITVYEPMKYWGAMDGKAMTIGVVGIGGLGTMGIKIAKAAGHRVVAISTSADKEKLAKSKGADAFIISKDPESMKTEVNKIDMIIDTVSADHQLALYLPLLKHDGRIVMLGIATGLHEVSQIPLMFARKKISGSLIGGIKNTEECLEFCAKHNIAPDCEMIEAKDISKAWDTL